MFDRYRSQNHRKNSADSWHRAVSVRYKGGGLPMLGGPSPLVIVNSPCFEPVSVPTETLDDPQVRVISN